MKAGFPLLAIYFMLATLGPRVQALAQDVPRPSTQEMYSRPDGTPSGQFIEYQSQIDRKEYGYYTPERQKIIDQIVEKTLQEGAASPHPDVVFFAGAMAAGKSQLVSRLSSGETIDLSRYIYLDPDKIKTLLPEFTDPHFKGPDLGSRLQSESIYIANMILEGAFRQGKNIIIDSSQRDAGRLRQTLNHLRDLQPQAQTTLYEVRAPLKELLERNALRYKTTGRLPPEDQVAQSHIQSPKTVRDVMDAFNNVYLYDNEVEPVLHYARVGKQHYTNPQGTSQTPQAEILSHAKSTEQPIDVILDMDWTLEYIIKGAQHKDATYRFTDAVAEVGSILTQIPGVRVSLFSGRPIDELETLARQVILKNGRTLSQSVFEMLSQTDLTEKPGFSPQARLSDRAIKNIKLVSSDLNLDRAVIVDDNANYVGRDQVRNLISFGKTYNFYESFKDPRTMDPAEAKSEFAPATYKDWALERGKLIWSLGIILSAIEQSKDGKMTFTDAVAKLQTDSQGNHVLMTHPSQIEFFKKGLDAIKKVNPQFKSVTEPILNETHRALSCRRILGL